MRQVEGLYAWMNFVNLSKRGAQSATFARRMIAINERRKMNKTINMNMQMI
jgi:hypothetical protein